MGRNINAKNIGIIIRALKEKDRYTKDLVALGVPKEITIRILRDYLQVWDLVEKNHEQGERWVWFEHAKGHYWKGTSLTYNIAIRHTQDLLPGLDGLVDMNWDKFLTDRNELFQNTVELFSSDNDKMAKYKKQLFFSKYVEQHFQSCYPKIHDSLTEFRTLGRKIGERQEELEKEVFESFKKKYEALWIITENFFIEGREKTCNRDWLREEFKKHGRNLNNVPYLIGPFQTFQEFNEATKNLRESCGDLGVTHLHGRIDFLRQIVNRNFENIDQYFIVGPVKVKIPDNDDRANVLIERQWKKFGEFVEQLFILKHILKNQPLDGKCDLCPQIIIKD